MEPISGVLLFCLAASLAANGFQVYRARINKKRRAPDITAQDLLHDLTRRGGAVIRVEVIDQAAFFLRSPRD